MILYDGFCHCSVFSSWILHWFIILLPWLWLKSRVHSEHVPDTGLTGDASVSRWETQALQIIPLRVGIPLQLLLSCFSVEVLSLRKAAVCLVSCTFSGWALLVWKEFSLWGVIQRLLSKSLGKAHGVLMTCESFLSTCQWLLCFSWGPWCKLLSCLFDFHHFK